MTFNENGLLTSAEISEGMSHDQSVDMPLLGFPIRSSSSLVFIGEKDESVARNRPSNLVSDSAEVKSITSHIPLSQIGHTITAALSECVDSQEDTCVQSITTLLQRLSLEDTQTYLNEFFTNGTTSSDFTERALILINSLSQLETCRESSDISMILTKHVLQSVNTPLIISLLRLFTLGRLLPER